MKKYNHLRVPVFSVSPHASTTVTNGIDLIYLLNDGYDILCATSISSEKSAGVEYILRKEIQDVIPDEPQGEAKNSTEPNDDTGKGE